MLTSGQIKSVSLNAAHVNSITCETINEYKGMIIDCKQTFKDLAQIDINLIYCYDKCGNVEYNDMLVYGSA